MGKLLSGRYGSPPVAESMALTLNECRQKLNLKPSDFVSEGPPKFFEKDFGTSGRYLLYLVETSDLQGQTAWKAGYYLLPLDAKDVLAAIDRRGKGKDGPREVLPIFWEEESTADAIIKENALKWGADSQPLFFKCTCKKLLLRVYPPWALRKRWKARLRCPGKCQPPITTLL